MLGEKRGQSLFRPPDEYKQTEKGLRLAETVVESVKTGIRLEDIEMEATEADAEQEEMAVEWEEAELEPAEAEQKKEVTETEEKPLPVPQENQDEWEVFPRFQPGEINSRANKLFFSTREGRDFSSVLKEVQEYISSKYAALLMDPDGDEVKVQIKRYMKKYIQDYRIAVNGMDMETLVENLYTEMAEFSFLTKYIFGTGIEEIDINSWRDIEVQYSSGRNEKLEEHFDSPEHAVNVIRRMLHVSGMVLDNASPAVLGHLSKNIRIAVLKAPLVDEDVGVAASIRIVNPQSMKKSDFVKGETATEEMLDFLAECIRYGISVCVAGATSSGKTTLAGWLLTTIPDSKRIFTIENGSRELDLVREKEGRVTNRVIHTLTRDSENQRQSIDQDTLLDMALRFNPEIICVGEMRSSEAYSAQEAARTGHTVLTTIHSNSCEATYRRMVTLCKRKYDISDETLMGLVTEAFPVIVFAKQLENKKRKIMEIMECEILPDGSRDFHTLYHYRITENRMEGGCFLISGTHEKVSAFSMGLKKPFLENGMPKERLEQLEEGIQ